MSRSVVTIWHIVQTFGVSQGRLRHLPLSGGRELKAEYSARKWHPADSSHKGTVEMEVDTSFEECPSLRSYAKTFQTIAGLSTSYQEEEDTRDPRIDLRRSKTRTIQETIQEVTPASTIGKHLLVSFPSNSTRVVSRSTSQTSARNGYYRRTGQEGTRLHNYLEVRRGSRVSRR